MSVTVRVTGYKNYTDGERWKVERYGKGNQFLNMYNVYVNKIFTEFTTNGVEPTYNKLFEDGIELVDDPVANAKIIKKQFTDKGNALCKIMHESEKPKERNKSRREMHNLDAYIKQQINHGVNDFEDAAVRKAFVDTFKDKEYGEGEGQINYKNAGFYWAIQLHNQNVISDVALLSIFFCTKKVEKKTDISYEEIGKRYMMDTLSATFKKFIWPESSSDRNTSISAYLFTYVDFILKMFDKMTEENLKKFADYNLKNPRGRKVFVEWIQKTDEAMAFTVEEEKPKKYKMKTEEDITTANAEDQEEAGARAKNNKKNAPPVEENDSETEDLPKKKKTVAKKGRQDIQERVETPRVENPVSIEPEGQINAEENVEERIEMPAVENPVSIEGAEDVQMEEEGHDQIYADEESIVMPAVIENHPSEEEILLQNKREGQERAEQNKLKAIERKQLLQEQREKEDEILEQEQIEDDSRIELLRKEHEEREERVRLETERLEKEEADERERQRVERERFEKEEADERERERVEKEHLEKEKADERELQREERESEETKTLDGYDLVSETLKSLAQEAQDVSHYCNSSKNETILTKYAADLREIAKNPKGQNNAIENISNSIMKSDFRCNFPVSINNGKSIYRIASELHNIAKYLKNFEIVIPMRFQTRKELQQLTSLGLHSIFDNDSQNKRARTQESKFSGDEFPNILSLHI